MRIIDRISEYSGRIFAPLVFLLAFVIFYGVIMRFGFHQPLVWGNGLSRLIFAAYIVSGGAYCLKHGAHVRMDLFFSRLSPRKQAIFEAVTAFMFFLFVVLILWESVDQSWFATSIGKTRGELAWNAPVWPVMWVLPLAATLLALQGVAKFVRDLYFAITARELK